MGHQISYILVAIVLPIIFVLICGITAYAINRKRSWYFKLTIWGAFSILLISPVLSVVIGQLAIIITNDGWVGLGLMMLSFEIAEAISILAFITGTVGYLVTKYRNSPRRPKVQNTDS
ncbi:hypothetical protein [Lysinibacillus fusiformis]|uniref:hypothetical protein n=1 Tax=Lysinibacillus fusiformis TaxID=28031 RepID=UPI003CFA3B26